MKKLFAFIATLALLGGVAFAAYDEGTAINNKEKSAGNPSTPVRVYQLVYYPEVHANVASISAGEVLFWDIISDDGVTVNRPAVLTKSTGATSADSVAGVAVGAIPTCDTAAGASSSIGSRSWGYIQTYGPNSATLVSSTVAAGQALEADPVNPGYAKGFLNQDASAGNAGSIFAFAYDAVSSSGQAEVFIKNR